MALKMQWMMDNFFRSLSNSLDKLGSDVDFGKPHLSLFVLGLQRFVKGNNFGACPIGFLFNSCIPDYQYPSRETLICWNGCVLKNYTAGNYWPLQYIETKKCSMLLSL